MERAAKRRYIKDNEKRLVAIHLLIEKGVIKSWEDIFQYIPPSVIAAHIGMSNGRMKDQVADPSGLTLQHLASIASFLKVKFIVIVELAYKAMPASKRKELSIL